MRRCVLIFIIGVVFSTQLVANKFYSSYKMVHNDGYNSNADSDYCYEKLKASGLVMSLNFEQIGNQKKHIVSLSVKSLEKFKRIKIDQIVFKTDYGVQTISLNSKLKPCVDIVEFEDTEIYAAYVKSFDLRLDKLFSKITKESFDVTVQLKGAIDAVEFDETYKFIATKNEREKCAPELLYKLFPGM